MLRHVSRLKNSHASVCEIWGHCFHHFQTSLKVSPLYSLTSMPSLPCPLGRPTLLCFCGCLQDEAEQGDMCSSHPLTHTRWIWETLITILKMHPPLLYEVLTFLRCCHCVGFAGGHTFCSRTYSAGTVVQGLSPHML